MKQKLLDMIAELEKEIIVFDNKNRKKFEELHASHKNRMEALRVYLVGEGMSPEWKIDRIEDDWTLHLHLNTESLLGIGRVALNRKGITSAILEDNLIQREACIKQQKQIYRLFSDGISFFNSIDFGMLDKKVRELDFCTENTIRTQRGIAYELYSRLEWFKKCIAEANK
jgi:hypothetical protein